MNKSVDKAVIQVEVKAGLDNPRGWKEAMTRLGLTEWIPDEEDPTQSYIESHPAVKNAGRNKRLIGFDTEDRMRG